MDKKRLTDRKREAIINAAMAEFQENGFAGTSMDKIAARAEVSKRTVYNHFPGKEMLFVEIMQQLWQRAMGAEQISYEPLTPLREQLSGLLFNKLELMAQPDFLALARVTMAEMIHNPEWARGILEKISHNESALVDWLRQAVADQRLKPLDPEFAANQLYSLLKGFAFWPQLTMGQPMPSPEQQQHIVDAAIEMFLARYQTP